MQKVRKFSKQCHSYNDVFKFFLTANNDVHRTELFQDLTYDYATSLRGCDLNEFGLDNKTRYNMDVSKALLTGVLRGNPIENMTVNINDALAILCSYQYEGQVDDKTTCSDAIKFCCKKSPHWRVHVEGGFRALGLFYEISASDYCELHGTVDGVATLLQKCSTNCAAICHDIGIGDYDFVVECIYDMIKDLTYDAESEIEICLSEKFNRFMEV